MNILFRGALAALALIAWLGLDGFTTSLETPTAPPVRIAHF